MAVANYKTPDFTYDPAKDLRAGRRPYRNKTFRLEALSFGNKLLVHNYGHGGAGITMGLGCAHEVRDMVRDSGRAPAGTRVAVLGGGIMGMTAAWLLAEMGLKVAVYAKSYDDTVSHVAGGQWSPSMVKHAPDTEARKVFDRILTRSFRGYKALMSDKDYGISTRPNFTSRKTPGYSKVPSGLIKPVPVANLSFDGHTGMSGYRYDTLLVEPPKFLARLKAELVRRKVPTHIKTFTSPAEVTQLPEPIIVNCTGLGSRDIWPDPLLVPRRGQLVFLPYQKDLPYLYSGMLHTCYIFPRSDFVVAGGSDDKFDNDSTDPRIAAWIIKTLKSAFAGEMSILRTLDRPSWAIRPEDE